MQGSEHMNQSIVILAHGSKRQDSKEVFLSLVDKVKRKLNVQSVIPAYLQFVEPNLEQAIELLYLEGYIDILVMPLFLFPGNHVKEDIPILITRIQAKYPRLKIRVTDIIGDDDRLVQIITERLQDD